jgi:hypothetical protein
MLWPCVGVLALAWLFTMIVGGLFTDPIVGYNIGGTSTGLFAANFSFFTIILCVQFLLLIWATINLMVSARGTARFGSILRVCVLSIIASTCVLAFGLAWGD